MKTSTMMTSAMPSAPVGKAWEEVSASFDRFCLTAGIETLGAMMEADAEAACGLRHSRSEDPRGHRWGRTFPSAEAGPSAVVLLSTPVQRASAARFAHANSELAGNHPLKTAALTARARGRVRRRDRAASGASSRAAARPDR